MPRRGGQTSQTEHVGNVHNQVLWEIVRGWNFIFRATTAVQRWRFDVTSDNSPLLWHAEITLAAAGRPLDSLPFTLL